MVFHCAGVFGRGSCLRTSHVRSSTAVQDLTCKPLCLFARKQSDSASDVVHEADAVERTPLGQGVVELLLSHLITTWNVLCRCMSIHLTSKCESADGTAKIPGLAAYIGLYASRRDDVDCNVSATEVDRQASAHALNGSFGGSLARMLARILINCATAHVYTVTWHALLCGDGRD